MSLYIGLYKIFLYFESFVHESNLLLFLPPICIAHPVAILLHNCRAVNNPLSTLRLYAMHHTIVVITTSCKGQTVHYMRLYNTTHLALDVDNEDGLEVPSDCVLEQMGQQFTYIDSHMDMCTTLYIILYYIQNI